MNGNTIYKKITLTDDVVKKFQELRAYKYKASVTRNQTWSNDGEILLTSNGNDSLIFFSVSRGNVSKTLFSKKCGVNVIRFVDDSSNIITCSCRSNNSTHKNQLRLWDVKENKIIKSLPQIGNICDINGIDVNQQRKLLLVNSDDGHIKIYSTNVNKPLGIFECNFMRPVSAFDQSGKIFACYFGRNEIHLYDLDMYAKGEFTTLNIGDLLNPEDFVTNLAFTSDGYEIIVTTFTNKHFKIDILSGNFVCSYEYPTTTPKSTLSQEPINYEQEERNGDSENVIKNELKHEHYSSAKNKSKENRESYKNEKKNYDLDSDESFFFPSISPDGEYVACGWKDKGIHIWKTNGTFLTSLYGQEGPTEHVHFNPQYAIIASSYLHLALWQPEI